MYDSHSIYMQIPLTCILLTSIISIIIWFPNNLYILGSQWEVPTTVQKYESNNSTCYHSLNACFLPSTVINALRVFIHLTFTTIVWGILIPIFQMRKLWHRKSSITCQDHSSIKKQRRKWNAQSVSKSQFWILQHTHCPTEDALLAYHCPPVLAIPARCIWELYKL